MITQKLQKDGDKFVLIISEEEAAQLGWKENDMIELNKFDDATQMRPEVEAAFKRSLARYAAAYAYLAEH